MCPLSTSCYANPFPVFQPAYRLITAITNAFPANVTTSFDHQYKDGTIIRLDIPPGFGMDEANQLFGSIIVTSPTTFDIDIDTRLFTPFVVPAVAIPACPQCVPIGEDNDTLKAATVNRLPY